MTEKTCSWCQIDLPGYMMEAHEELHFCPKCESHFQLQLSKARNKEPFDAPDRIADLIAQTTGEETQKAKEERAQALAQAAEAKRDAQARARRVKEAEAEFARQHEEAVQAQEEERTSRELARKELARRALSAKHLLPFVKYHMPTYQAGWVHKDICRRLEKFSEQVARGESPRLMLAMPPRHGKSQLASQSFPAWHLGRHPTHDIITASYSAALATDFSKKVRALVKTPSYQAIFPKCGIDPENQNAEGWSTLHGGQYVPAGVGGPMTGRGAHCLPLSAKVLTPDGPRTMEWLINNSHKPLTVLSYDGTHVVERPINAILTRRANGFYRVQTSTGPIEATGSHPLCVGFDGARPLYRRVDDLRAGDELFAVEGTPEARDPALCPVPDVRHGVHSPTGQVQAGQEAVRGAIAHLQQSVLRAVAGGRRLGGAVLRHLRSALSGMGLGRREETPAGGRAPLLLEQMLRGLPLQNLCRGEASPLQLSGDGVPPVRDRVLEEAIGGQRRADETPVLRPGVLRRVATWSAYPEKFKDSRGEILPVRVQAPAGRRDGDETQVCRVWRTGNGPAPQGRGSGEQRPEQPGTGLSQLPRPAPSARTDCRVESIEWVPGDVTVADLEVEGTHSFLLFNGVLSRNCLIIDDPIKNREEAESSTQRQSIKDWYTSTAYTRLAPGGGVLCIQTRWHEDDLSGWLLSEMEDGTGDQWEVVKYPAIATESETYRDVGDALHPDRYPLSALERIKNAVGRRDWQALYQQDPIGEEGDFFNGSDFQYYLPDDRPPIEELTIYAAWDLAIGTREHNDFTVGVVFGIDRSLNLWMLDLYRGKWGSLEIVDKLFECYDKWHPAIIGIERTHVEQAIGPLINEQKRRRNKFAMRVEPLKPGRRDKVARAQPIRGLIEMHRVYFPKIAPWLDDFVSEMLKFPNGKFDDQVDAISWLGQMCELYNPRPLPKPKPKKSWKDNLEKFVRHGPANTSHMSS